MIRPLAAATALIALSACARSGGGPPDGFRLAAPTKDEVALVDDHPVSIAAYLHARDSLKKPTPESSFRVAALAALLRVRASAQGRALTDSDALLAARFAEADTTAEEARPSFIALYGDASKIPPEEAVRDELRKLLLSATIQRNVQALAELR